MKKVFIFLAAVVMAAGGMRAEEHSYVWNAEFPNYKQQIPSSDFTTADGLFRFTSDKAQGVSGPQFNEDKNAGLLLRLLTKPLTARERRKKKPKNLLRI